MSIRTHMIIMSRCYNRYQQMSFREFITPEGLQQLRQYKYKSGGYTWLDNLMNPFWECTVNLLPRSVAPNLITFVGWIFVILSYANILVYDYTFEKDVPAPCFFFAAFCIFVYSTLDAIDGKQARRTGSSSPLGQLFDHGCDSFSVSFFILAICQAVKLEKTEVLLLFIGSQTSFWTSNWMQYNTGVLTTKVGQFGVTEAQFTCLFIHLITGIFGQDFWRISISAIIPAPVWQVLCRHETVDRLLRSYGHLHIGAVAVYFYSSLMFVMCLYIYLKTTWKSHNRVKVIFEFFTLHLIIVMEVIWAHFSFYELYRGIVLTNFGLVESLIICKMIIASVTKMHFEYFHREIVPLLLSTIIMMALDLADNISGSILVFWATFAVNITMILLFLYHTIRQITDFLGIYCFSLQKRAKPMIY